jgi:hypothetical protein
MADPEAADPETADLEIQDPNVNSTNILYTSNEAENGDVKAVTLRLAIRIA